MFDSYFGNFIFHNNNVQIKHNGSHQITRFHNIQVHLAIFTNLRWFSCYQFKSYSVRLGDQQPFRIGSPIQAFLPYL